MGLSHLSFRRDWKNPADFPTVEPDEATVRADLQYHPDAIKDYINGTLIPSHDALTSAKHSHDNKTVLDGITADDVAKWRGTIGTFRINVTHSDGIYSADKTFDEIKAAYDAGQQPFVVLTGGTFDLVYTLANFDAPTDGSEPKFVDFERYLVGEGILETEMLRVYSYTTDSGSNVVKRIDEFKMPTSLKNPNALTFTGGATGSYDGSEPETVHIPVIPYKVINENTAARHSHDNKTVLDGITAEKVTKWDDNAAGADGEDGATFTPSVSASGTLSWTNNKGLPNPGSVNIRGPAGADGEDGYTPVRGTDYWTADDIATIQSYIDEKATVFQSKSITDSGGYFHTDTVEGALQEIGAELAGVNVLLGSGIQISFTIDDGSEVNTFSAVSGETWTEWIGTGRLVGSGLVLHIYGGVVATEAGVYALSLDGSTAVSGSDKIISGATYTIISYGG